MSKQRQLKLSSWFTKNPSTESLDSREDEINEEGNPSTVVDTEICTGDIEKENVSSECNRSDQRQLESLDVRCLDEPFQPENYNFPKTTEKGNNFGRSCQSSWFKAFPWLHYNINRNAVFCFVCLKAMESRSFSELSIKQSDAFTKVGFKNWNHALERSGKTGKKKLRGFYKHEESNAHKEAVSRYLQTKTYQNVMIDNFSTQSLIEKRNNRRALLKIISNIRHLSRQSNSFRGNWNSETGTEENSNFNQLLKLRAEDDPFISEWMERKEDKFTSPKIQNEIIDDLAEQVLKTICEKMKDANFFSIMADESADVSNQEQVVVCIRWVGNDFEMKEDFVGIEPVARCTAEDIVNVLIKTLKKLGLKIEDCRGQCYDGASVMSGKKSGVAQRLKVLNNRCLYTHCYGHALNLCVKDSCVQIDLLKNCFSTTKEISNLVKKSPQRETMLKKLRLESGNKEKSVHAFCPTRWTVRGSTLEAIVNNHKELMDLWERSRIITLDVEMRGRIIGVQSEMKTFDFIFGCLLGETVLRQTDNLSRALQNSHLCAVEAQELASNILEVLNKDRCDDCFNLFWDLVNKKVNDLDVVEGPFLKRKKKAPRRYDEGADPHVFASPKEHYRKIYYEVYDSIKDGIKKRFDQPDFKMYATMQNVLLKAARGDEVNEEIKKEVMVINGEKFSFEKLYSKDIDFNLLRTQLSLLQPFFKDVKYPYINDILDFIQKMSKPKQQLLSEIVLIVKLLLVVPATNAESERTFSAMKRVKNYLRSTMGTTRLNSLMILSIHKDVLDDVDLIAVAKVFVAKKNHRREIFGEFSESEHTPQWTKSKVCNQFTQT